VRGSGVKSWRVAVDWILALCHMHPWEAISEGDRLRMNQELNTTEIFRNGAAEAERRAESRRQRPVAKGCERELCLWISTGRVPNNPVGFYYDCLLYIKQSSRPQLFFLSPLPFIPLIRK
jgi:hypothetical protein